MGVANLKGFPLAETRPAGRIRSGCYRKNEGSGPVGSGVFRNLTGRADQAGSGKCFKSHASGRVGSDGVTLTQSNPREN